MVLDPLNGDNSIKGYSLLKPLGRIIHFGVASMTSESRSLVSAFKTWWKCLSINSLDIMSDNKMIGGYHLGVLCKNPAFLKRVIDEDMKVLIDLYQQKKIRIKIDSTYSYSKIGEAMKRMHLRQNIGKIILKPDSELEPQVSNETVLATSATAELPTSSSGINETHQSSAAAVIEEGVKNIEIRKSDEEAPLTSIEKNSPTMSA